MTSGDWNPRRLLAQWNVTRAVALHLLRLRNRLPPPNAGLPMVVNSIPKAGTHLVAAVLETLFGYQFAGDTVIPAHYAPERPAYRGQLPTAVDWDRLERRLTRVSSGRYVNAHIHHDPDYTSRALQRPGHLFVIRDPFAIATSFGDYVASTRRHSARAEFADLSPVDRVVRSVAGFAPSEPGARGLLPLRACIRPFMGWLDDDRVTVVRFEALAGDDDVARADAIDRIATALRLESPTSVSASAYLGRRSSTFRSGRVAPWKELPADVQGLLEDELGEIRATMGYA